MNKVSLLIACFVCSLTISTSMAQGHQEDHSSGRSPDVFTMGFGFGLDYGGFGLNATVYPQENIGLFVGGGFALAGFGYNAGLKLRLLPKKRSSTVSPFLLGMYGYNAAIFITNDTRYNKLFYGPSFGAGVDIGSRNRGYLSLALLVPVRSSDVNDYMDQLRANGVTFNNNLIPIAFSLGYKFVIN
jgi:hypothetical protein